MRRGSSGVAVLLLLVAFPDPAFAYLPGGERKEEARGRWFNLRMQPIGAILGEYNADLSIAPLPFLSLGGIWYMANMSMSGISVNGQGYGARLTLHFSGNRFSDSWIFSAYGYKVPRISMAMNEYSGTFSDVYEIGGVIGKMWVWSWGFNFTLAAGYRQIKYPDPMVLTSPAGSMSAPGSTQGFRLELALGWAFL